MKTGLDLVSLPECIKRKSAHRTITNAHDAMNGHGAVPQTCVLCRLMIILHACELLSTASLSTNAQGSKPSPHSNEMQIVAGQIS